MIFKCFSILSSGGHFFQRCGMILAILVERHSKNISVKHFCKINLKSGHWSRRRCHLKVVFFYF